MLPVIGPNAGWKLSCESLLFWRRSFQPERQTPPILAAQLWSHKSEHKRRNVETETKQMGSINWLLSRRLYVLGSFVFLCVSILEENN